MCFSATASFVAGAALTGTGVLTIKKAETKAEIPFASIPFLFGIQQLIEGVVWLSFGNAAVNVLATYSFSLFSHVLWPILVPFSVLLLETNPIRKKILWIFSIIGLIVGLYLLYFIVTEPITSKIVNRSIAYNSPHLFLYPMLFFYFLATCVSCFFSSHKIINLFGIVALASAAIATWFFTETFLSVWCFFAAILSVLVYWFFKKKPTRVS
ncbi:MAG: hypothetical protein AB202_02625 [Parcubacteria bacterium C7867-007]|nr:MAG: hypothetical protein AB202_02625 [Parcubacteria bacterium C7867-007]